MIERELTDEILEHRLMFCGMRPDPTTPVGKAWEEGARQTWRWAQAQVAQPAPPTLPRGFGAAFAEGLSVGQMVKTATPTIPGIDITPMQLVQRAVKNAIPHRADSAARSVAVMNTFGCGSTYAKAICRHFGLDPDEEVRGRACEQCQEDTSDED